jgi:hypothetical protein
MANNDSIDHQKLHNSKITIMLFMYTYYTITYGQIWYSTFQLTNGDSMTCVIYYGLTDIY